GRELRRSTRNWRDYCALPANLHWWLPIRLMWESWNLKLASSTCLALLKYLVCLLSKAEDWAICSMPLCALFTTTVKGSQTEILNPKLMVEPANCGSRLWAGRTSASHLCLIVCWDRNGRLSHPFRALLEMPLTRFSKLRNAFFESSIRPALGAKARPM